MEKENRLEFQTMKTLKLVKVAASLLILAVAATEAFANPQRNQTGDRYVYVWVTGSRIPQKVKVTPIGTNTVSAMSVWDRRQINQTGRVTTEGVLAQDPSVRVISQRLAGRGPSSSARFKDEIKPMDKTSEAILALKPVTFRYKKQIDRKGIPQFGLVAEDVEKVNPDLVTRDRDGKLYTVRYDAVNAMLLNEFLKEHQTVQEQGAAIAEFKKEIANLTATVKEQAAQIQKVSAQVELGKPAPQAVNNP
jgi:hypothetical protein